MDEGEPQGVQDEPGSERRRLPRSKGVLFSGVIVDLEGKKVLDCTVLDISVDGAQVAMTKRPPKGSEVYLLDVRNRAAHRSRIVWINGDRAGLHFLATIDLSRPLPLQLDFLNRILLETKLRQVLKLTQQGVSGDDAKTIAGFAGEEQLSLF
jgi:hypothetical protein